MLARDKIIFVKGLLEGECLWHIREKIDAQLRAHTHGSSPPITICITSPGGHLASTYGFFEECILFGPHALHTIALDDTGSAALFLYISGARRFVAPHTTFFFHTLYSHIDDYCKNIAHACGKKPEDIAALMTAEGTILSAENALSMGLAHEILSGDDEQQLRAWRDAPEI